MRAPGEASGSAALEAAMDEAAFACGLDPLEFRLRNAAVTEIGLDYARVDALRSEGKAARVAQHLGMRRA